MTPERAATKITEAYFTIDKSWARLAEVKEITGLGQADLVAGCTHLMKECDDFMTEPIFMAQLVKPDDREAAVMVAGEPHHLIRFHE